VEDQTVKVGIVTLTDNFCRISNNLLSMLQNSSKSGAKICTPPVPKSKGLLRLLEKAWISNPARIWSLNDSMRGTSHRSCAAIAHKQV
jgi:hypothetical protein